MKTSLEQKTIRPGSLTDYSFYYSNRQAPAAPAPKLTAASPLTAKRFALILAVLIVGFVGFNALGGKADDKTIASTTQSQASVVGAKKDKSTPATVAPIAKNECAANTLDKFIVISIKQRHMWACTGTKVAYDAAVITGMEKHPSTLTPIGTYKIYGKMADTVLTGSDETGTWRDPVSYWMPFLDNQYGTYGFHDATWRDNSEFGKIDPYTSDDASHGCIELPLAASKWLYEWAPVGTTVTVET